MMLPDVMLQSLESIKRGELTVRFDLQHFENLVRQLTRASNTLAFGILIAGVSVSASLVLRVGYNWLAYGGFAIAFLMLLWLFWNMARD
jgi:ubiquinone biosynthesis protein